MKPMLVLMLAGVLIGDIWVALSENQAQAHRRLAQGGGEAEFQIRPVASPGPGVVQYQRVQPGGKLIGVTRYQFDEQRKLQAASFVVAPSTRRFLAAGRG